VDNNFNVDVRREIYGRNCSNRLSQKLVPLYKTLRCHITQVRNYRSFEPDVRGKYKGEKYL